MPAPLVIPAMRYSTPGEEGSSKLRDMSLGKVSVVQMAFAHSSQWVVLIANLLVRGASHAGSIFKTSGAGDSICVARIDDDASQTSVILLLQQFPTVRHGSSLELVLCKDTSSSAWSIRGDDGDIGLAGVSRLDASQDA
ncbi:hypothetical protein HG531_006393 [Fusarium graminearum]|nr:hypothetical protein HG531_006393 [Fusarium graminearum]